MEKQITNYMHYMKIPNDRIKNVRRITICYEETDRGDVGEDEESTLCSMDSTANDVQVARIDRR